MGVICTCDPVEIWSGVRKSGVVSAKGKNYMRWTIGRASVPLGVCAFGGPVCHLVFRCLLVSLFGLSLSVC